MSSVLSDPVSLPTDLSHMPFLFADGDDLALVFAWSRLKPRRVPQYSRSGTTRIWRLMHRSYDPRTGTLGPVLRIETGLEANEVTCSACVSQSDGQIHVSFIGTAHHGTGTLEHHLFRMSGPSLDQLGPAMRLAKCYCGFWRPDLMATAAGTDGEFQLQGDMESSFSTSFSEIGRLSFDPSQPWQLLITGSVAADAEPRTIVYHAKFGVVLGELQVNGAPAYKPAVCDGVLAYPQLVESRYREPWRLAFTNSFSIVPTSITVTRIG